MDLYDGANAGLILYDVCRRSSLRNVKRWYKMISKFIVGKSHIWIVGNKIDLESSRIIREENVKEEFGNIDFNYFEISAKNLSEDR